MTITKQDLIELILEDSVQPIKVSDVTDEGFKCTTLDDPFAEILHPFKKGFVIIIENRIVRRLRERGILHNPGVMQE